MTVVYIDCTHTDHLTNAVTGFHGQVAYEDLQTAEVTVLGVPPQSDAIRLDVYRAELAKLAEILLAASKSQTGIIVGQMAHK